MFNWRSSRSVNCWAAAAALFVAPDGLAQAPTYASETRSYQEALASGDGVSATAHALAAWKAAEAEFGDDERTSRAAQIYGMRVLFESPGASLEALQRASALVDASVSPHDPDLERALAYATFLNGRTDYRARRRARKSLEQIDEKAEPSALSARLWLDLARRDFEEIEAELARRAAEKAVAASRAVASRDIHVFAEALLINGILRFLASSRSPADIEAALVDFDEAIRLFPPQVDIDSFDLLLGRIAAWQHAAYASYLALDPDRARTAFDRLGRQQVMQVVAPPDDACGVEWQHRPAPDYPGIAAYRGTMGAVIVGYRLGDDVVVRDVRVLGEAPGHYFSNAVLAAMASWRLRRPPLSTPECRHDRLQTFTFSF